SLSGATGCVPVAGITAAEVPIADTPPTEAVPGRTSNRRALALVGLGLLGVVLIGVVIASFGRSRPEGDSSGARPTTPDGGVKVNADREKEEALKKLVEQYLREKSPEPAGVDACIDLGVLYLEQDRDSEAEKLFRRMDERRPPSAYHFVGRLGLAVTDALKKDFRASHAKFRELFDPRSKDNRVQILNDYLTRNPEFAKWVNEADSHHVRHAAS